MTAEPQTLSLGPGATDLGRRILEHQAPQYTFSFTPFLLKNYRHGISPDRPTCKAYLQGHCPLGNSCPDKHITPNNNPNFNNLVCKHWLRGLCKKGDSCEFLHEFNLRKMPECSQFVRNGYCSNGDECLYLHPSPESRLPPCPHYDKGFCPLGPICSKKHVRNTLCPFYLAGFCPDGPKCKNAHPRFPTDLAKPAVRIEKTEEEKEEEMRVIREQIEREEELQRERWATNDEGSRGRGRGRWTGGFGGGRGRGQRSQRGRGHY